MWEPNGLPDEVGGSIPPQAAMKWKFLIISLAMGSLSLAQDTCITKVGCKRVIKGDSLCYIHGGDINKVLLLSHRCIDYTNSKNCLLYTSPSPRDQRGSRLPSYA